ncbi:hypothetical protein NBRC116602_09500 [Hyphomicrobiales bacterium 4NK60-0047b]
MIRCFLIGLAVLFGLNVFIFTSMAFADGNSVYTDTDLKKCTLHSQAEEGEGEWATFICRGFAGQKVFVSEADLRFSLGYGHNGLNQKSFSQRLSPFNTVGKKMEWRLRHGRPIATILRYYTETGSGGRKGQILVVTKLEGSEACHMAYVDALANKGANEMAQNAADRLVDGFSCETDSPVHVGERGVSAF